MAIEVQPAVSPHLVVGDGADAIDFYVKAFSAVELGRVPGPDGKLMHAALQINGSTVLPRDRIEPLIGRELLHASGIDIPPQGSDLITEEWQSRGVLLSMADEPIDLALAAEATPEFRQVDLGGKYVFSVFERFALRIKDAKAIAPLQFREP